jgi:hypothetical protein
MDFYQIRKNFYLQLRRFYGFINENRKTFYSIFASFFLSILLITGYFYKKNKNFQENSLNLQTAIHKYYMKDYEGSLKIIENKKSYPKQDIMWFLLERKVYVQLINNNKPLKNLSLEEITNRFNNLEAKIFHIETHNKNINKDLLGQTVLLGQLWEANKNDDYKKMETIMFTTFFEETFMWYYGHLAFVTYHLKHKNFCEAEIWIEKLLRNFCNTNNDYIIYSDVSLELAELLYYIRQQKYLFEKKTQLNIVEKEDIL